MVHKLMGFGDSLTFCTSPFYEYVERRTVFAGHEPGAENIYKV